MSAIPVEVGRDGGAHKSFGTFGKSERFGKKHKVGMGVHSPEGLHFYKRNALFKNAYLELGKECTQGIGQRSAVLALGSTPHAVGPGSYEIIASAKDAKSPLDGEEYCTTTIKVKLGSSLVPKNMCSPGPHAKYEVRKDLDKHINDPADYKNFPKLSRGARTRYSEDNDGPGPGGYDQHHRTLGGSTVVPSAKTGAHKGDEEESKRLNLRAAPKFGTFGTGERFAYKAVSHSPDGEMYYVHSKIMMAEDYQNASRTCGMGGGQKTDFANPGKIGRNHRTQVSPVTYNPVSSMAKKTSALDGFAMRCTSPVYAGTRGLGAVKRTPKAMESPSPTNMQKRTMSEPGLMRRVDSKEGTADASGVAGADATGSGN
jgi:hypothetical protein